MTRSIFRVVLTSLALGLLFAGSINLNHSNAAVSLAPSKCQELAGCPGGPITCGTIQLPDGTTIRCGEGGVASETKSD
jgi:hypothetical protein